MADTPEQVGWEMRAPTVRVVMRNYFSVYLLWTAEDAAIQAQRIEEGHGAGDHPFNIAHRAAVLNAILSSAAFLEAVVNELYQDAYDGHGIAGDGYIAPLAEEVRWRLAQIWEATDEGSKLRPLDKYELLLMSAGCDVLDKGNQPFQDALLVVQLRNAIAHYQPEDVSADVAAKTERKLRGKFPDNPLMKGQGNAWWPDHCLGYGCAKWAHGSATALTDRVSGDLGLRLNYIRNREDNWRGLGGPPGKR